MTVKVQILIGIILILVLGVILNMVRKRELELKYVLAWLFCDLALLFFTCFPDAMAAVASFLGIYSPVNMIFFLGFVFSLIIIFSLTVALSRVTAKVRRMAQMMALENYKPEKDGENSEAGEQKSQTEIRLELKENE